MKYNKKFWEELSPIFLSYNIDRIENDASSCWWWCILCGLHHIYINRTASGFQELWGIHRHRQQNKLESLLLLFFQNKESRLKI
jgi:hypothetical protein